MNLLVRLLKSITDSMLDNLNVAEGTQTIKTIPYNTSQTQANTKTEIRPIEPT